MKKYILLLAGFLILMSGVYSQNVVKETNFKKFNMGVDIFTDFLQDTPEDVEFKTINRGFNVFGMYNYRFGLSNFSFAIGLGLGSHNFYSNALVSEANDSTFFVKIADSIDYKKSKLNVNYIDLPLEFRLKTPSKFRLALGFKAGILLSKHTKYKGKNALHGGSEEEIILKSTDVNYLEKFRYGPTLRIGYKWINFTAYYQISKLFKPEQGPQMYPISVGITLMPY